MSGLARRVEVGTGTGARRLSSLMTLLLPIATFYFVTAPANHSLAVDAYYYADLITRSPLDGVPHRRAMLWILGMQGLYQAAAVFVSDPDPFLIARIVNSVLTALAVLLLARILERDFGESRSSAGLTAALFGVCYGVWRYATEIEVYAPAVLASLLIVHATFASDRATTESPAGQIVRLAALGGIATLVYQPLGFLPALAVPAYLLARGRLRQLPLYYLVAGTIVLAGFGGAYLLGRQGPEGDPISFVFHTEDLQPSVLTPTGFAKMIYAIGSSVLSTHWASAHESIRAVMMAAADDAKDEIYAATRAGWVVWVPVVTLPVALALTLGLVPFAWRRRLDPGIRTKHRMIAFWLLLHAIMKMVLHPGGLEGWILALVPMSILVGVNLVGPAVGAGRRGLVAAFVAVMFAHNLLAGLGVLRSPAGDYLYARGDPILARTGPDDLIALIPRDWRLQSYLDYEGDALTLRVDPASKEIVRQAITETLAAGGRVVVLDNATGILDESELAGAQRFGKADAGAAYLLDPRSSRP